MRTKSSERSWLSCIRLLLFLLPFSSKTITVSSTELVAVVSESKDIITVVEDVTSNVMETWIIAENTTGSKLPLILSRFKEVSDDILSTESQYDESVSNFINSQLLAKRNDITNTILGITTRFKELKELIKHQANLESSTLKSFAEWTVSPNGFSVHHLMDRLHFTMFGSDDEINKMAPNIFQSLVLSYGNKEKCVNLQSTQQYIYSLYTDIALTEAKAYAMQQFSYMILRSLGQGHFTQEAELKHSNYIDRNEKTVRLLNKVMENSDRNVWRCDPPEHKEGKTYEEVTRFLQGYIENEVDMSTSRECLASCSAYKRTNNQGCYMEQFCARQERCSGNIHDCYYVSKLRACPSPLERFRRYEYVTFNTETHGKYVSCTRGESEILHWRRYLFWDCDYCYCLCDDQDSPKTDRYFNLRDTLANVKNNMVVTGLRFKKVNRIFHLQIQEAKLLPRGMTNASSVRWKPVDSYTLYERDVNNKQDYFTLTYDERSIDLDVIETDDPSLVITGVRFRLVKGHLNIQARYSKFNFETGKLIDPDENSFWKFHDMHEYRRTKIDMTDLDISTATTEKSIPNFGRNLYLQFSPTSLHTDVSQTTVPFIDIQDVASMPAVPLAGIGLYYKGRPGYGGYIAPKIITYDFRPYIYTARTN